MTAAADRPRDWIHAFARVGVLRLLVLGLLMLVAVCIWSDRLAVCAVILWLLTLPVCAASLLAHVAWWRARRRPGAERSSGRVVAVAALTLLVDPAAAAVGVAAMLTYFVSVRNDSGEVVRSVRLAGGGVERQLGDLPPGDWTWTLMWFEGEGQLVLTAGGSPPSHTAVVDDYVCGPMGGRRSVRLGSDGAVDVR